MNSPLFNEWFAEERKEVAKETAKESAQKYIIELLTEKFDFVPNPIRESIKSIDDIAILDELHKKIMKIETIESFKALVQKAKNI